MNPGSYEPNGSRNQNSKSCSWFVIHISVTHKTVAKGYHFGTFLRIPVLLSDGNYGLVCAKPDESWNRNYLRFTELGVAEQSRKGTTWVPFAGYDLR